MVRRKKEMRENKESGSFKKEDIGKEVSVRGWVNRRSDHGGVIFICQF